MDFKTQYLQGLHARLLEILTEFDEFCRRHELVYWLDFGTLLGAVREKGFIAWDEDVDLAMPATHFAKLIALGERGELPPNLALWLPPRTRFYFKEKNILARIVDRNSRYHDAARKPNRQTDDGVHMDIFAVWTLPEARFPALRKAAAYFACDWERAANPAVRLVKSLLNRRLRAAKIATAMFKRNSVALQDAAHLQHGACLQAWRKDEVFPLAEKEFAGRKFPVQKNFHEYLSAVYGDYMTPPPPAEREPVILRFFDIRPRDGADTSGDSGDPKKIRPRKIRVYIGGIFDLFHVGHLRAIRAARALATERGAEAHLIAGVGSDESAAEYKRRPVIPFAQRMELVAAIDGVDEVIEGPNYADAEFYKKHRIDMHVQGDDPAGMDFYAPGKKLGVMRFAGRQEITSSTEIIGEILERGEE